MTSGPEGIVGMEMGYGGKNGDLRLSAVAVRELGNEEAALICTESQSVVSWRSSEERSFLGHLNGSWVK